MKKKQDFIYFRTIGYFVFIDLPDKEADSFQSVKTSIMQIFTIGESSPAILLTLKQELGVTVQTKRP